MTRLPAASSVPSAATGGPPPHRRRRAGRRAFAVTAGAAALTITALAVQACADGGLTGSPTPIVPARADGATPGALETATAGTKGTGELAWVGALHNRGLDAVLARARVASADDRATAKARCALIGRLTVEYLQGERGRDAHLAAVGTSVGDDALARIAHDAACGAASGAPRSLADALAGAGEPALGGERRLDLSGDGTLSPAAVTLLNQIDDSIRWMTSAATLNGNLMRVRIEADALPDLAERVLVSETVETAVASAYYHEQRCQTDPVACDPEGRLPDATRAPGAVATGTEYRTGVIRDVVQADAWGCIFGGIRGGILGGPPGALSGCFWGGIGASGGVIFRHIT